MTFSLPIDPLWRILSITGIILFVCAWVLMFGWTVRDVMNRTTNMFFQCLALTTVALLHIVGLFLYLLFRPRKTLSETYYETLEHQALDASLDEEICGKCLCKVTSEFTYCPQCSHTLKKACTKCKKLMRPSWTVCPYCGHSPAHKKSKKS